MHLKMQPNFIANGRESLNANVPEKSDNAKKKNIDVNVALIVVRIILNWHNALVTNIYCFKNTLKEFKMIAEVIR